MNNKEIQDTTFKVVRQYSVPTTTEKLRIKKLGAEQLIQWATTQV